MKRVLQLVAAASVVVTHGSAFAYTCAFDAPGGDGCVTWCMTDTVTYQVGELPDGLAESDVVAAVDAAAQLWNDIDCGTLRLENVGRTPATGQDADVELTWLRTWDTSFGSVDQTFTVALNVAGGDGCLLPGSIVFNEEGFDWTVDGEVTNSSRRIFDDAAANFGRILGLGSSNLSNQSIISATPVGVITELGSDDIDGFCALYDPQAGEDMGNVDPDMGSPADMGSTADMGAAPADMAEGIASDMKVEGPEQQDAAGSGCQTTASGPQASTWLLLGFGLILGGRRRR